RAGLGDIRRPEQRVRELTDGALEEGCATIQSSLATLQVTVAEGQTRACEEEARAPPRAIEDHADLDAGDHGIPCKEGATIRARLVLHEARVVDGQTSAVEEDPAA